MRLRKNAAINHRTIALLIESRLNVRLFGRRVVSVKPDGNDDFADLVLLVELDDGTKFETILSANGYNDRPIAL